jgi:hypothetical protein
MPAQTFGPSPNVAHAKLAKQRKGGNLRPEAGHRSSIPILFTADGADSTDANPTQQSLQELAEKAEVKPRLPKTTDY